MKLGIFKGFREWVEKIEEIKKLNLPVEDFYSHLEKEVKELVEGRNEDEMSDVMNLVGMCYMVGKYKTSFYDCLNKLKIREEKYEQRRQSP
jgi:predicted house-cleaning noncanonical NTP pyrophosphatase (MazG superfamily)